MALIITFLGKGGTGRTTLAIASARQLAQQGKRVLLTTQDASPAFSMLLGKTVGTDPTEIAPNFQALQFKSAQLLESSWEELKTLEAQYVRTPFFKNVYGQELGVLPGMDSALALNAIRQYEAGDQYDVIIYDGIASPDVLRMLGMPEILSWYLRRFRQVFLDSDFWKSLSPFVQPVASTVLSVDISANNFSQPTNQASNMLDQGTAAVADPNRVVAYLVTTSDPAAVATAHYLWGCAQQVGLTVGGALLNQAETTPELSATFAPLGLSLIPQRSGDDWQSLTAALPDFQQASNLPKPITIDAAQSQVTLFLPGFDKKQIKLTQYGPEVTIEAGDQRRNILLPDSLRGKPVTGAKFQENHLTISF
ncbi:MAG: ArsA family ATPase [Oscillatoriales cyanobacterium RM2_1_1]|nr:ArsA family ATPase [Oscillatoriales cyanobacterium SM2_3_0]NJO46716.1 ArsA family ATPase [Oscillatoriales cyanobacterium RM2_1_1]